MLQTQDVLVVLLLSSTVSMPHCIDACTVALSYVVWQAGWVRLAVGARCCLMPVHVIRTSVLQAINGVPRLTEGLNPATWMLQVSTPGMEANIGVNFADIYKQSGLYT